MKIDNAEEELFYPGRTVACDIHTLPFMRSAVSGISGNPFEIQGDPVFRLPPSTLQCKSALRRIPSELPGALFAQFFRIETALLVRRRKSGIRI